MGLSWTTRFNASSTSVLSSISLLSFFTAGSAFPIRSSVASISLGQPSTSSGKAVHKIERVRSG